MEQEISDIEQKLSQKRAELEQKKQSGQIDVLPHEKETLYEVVGEKIQEKIPGFQPSAPPEVRPSSPQAVQPPAISAPPIQEPPSYLSPELKDKVQELVNLAFQKSPGEAFKQLQNINNPALMEAFHGVLVDELYPFLLERGKIKKL